MERYLQINTFFFYDFGGLDAISMQVQPRHMQHIRNVHTQEFWIFQSSQPLSYWDFPSDIVEPLVDFYSLKYLSVYAGPIDVLPGHRERKWKSTPRPIRRQRYELLVNQIISTLPALPIGLELEVRTDLYAVWSDNVEERSASRDRASVVLSKTRIGPETGSGAAKAWSDTIMYETIVHS
jgi:hypothetical protein